MTTDMQREAFETWARSVGYPVFQHETEDDWYVHNPTQDAYEGWQAAIRHLTEKNEQRDSHE